MKLDDARRLLVGGRAVEAERLARAEVRRLEKLARPGGLAGALTTHATALARLGRHAQAQLTFRRAAEVAEAEGDRQAEGEAALAALEELGERLGFREASALYLRASEALGTSQTAEVLRRLNACARVVLRAAPEGGGRAAATKRGGQASESAAADAASGGVEESRGGGEQWEDFSLRAAVHDYEKQIIERALKDAEGVVTRAAHLLGFKHHNSLIALLNTRHRELLPARSPVVPRRRAVIRPPRPRPARARGEETQARPNESGEVTILHVGDNRVVAEAVRGALRGEGWKVAVCSDGFAALKMIESNVRYDLLLIDNDLPGLSGLELVREARRLPHRERTPVVMLTSGGYMKEAHRAGVDAFLRKPEDIPSLARLAARLLDAGPG